MNTVPAFEKWFGASKVVDAKGAPLVVYHGTGFDFDTFDNAKLGLTTGNPTAVWGHAFASNKEYANGMARSYAGNGRAAPNVLPVYLSLANPYEMTYAEMTEFQSLGSPPWDGKLEALREKALAFKATLLSDGYDGIIMRTKAPLGDVRDHNEFIAFHASQIKSALGNNGDFDGANTDIRFSLADLDEAIGTEAPCP